MCMEIDDGDRCKHGKHRPGRIKGFLEACLLLLLTEKPTYGYELLESISRFGVELSNQDVGSIYRILRRLEDEGKVRSQWDTDKGGPARRLYEVTPEGKQALDNWAEILNHSKDRIERFLASYSAIKEGR